METDRGVCPRALIYAPSDAHKSDVFFLQMPSTNLRFVFLHHLSLSFPLSHTHIFISLLFFALRPSGKSLLESDMDVECWSDEHWSAVGGMAIPAFFFFVLLIPFVGLILVLGYRGRLNEEIVKDRVGFLYSSYEPKYYFWEVVIVMR